MQYMVSLFHEDTAHMWLENPKPTLTLWKLFKQEGRRAFAVDHSMDGSEYALRTRIEQPNKNVPSFAEYFIGLLGPDDLTMTEYPNVHFLIWQPK